jgi:hypothetical protein
MVQAVQVVVVAVWVRGVAGVMVVGVAMVLVPVAAKSTAPKTRPPQWQPHTSRCFLQQDCLQTDGKSFPIRTTEQEIWPGLQAVFWPVCARARACVFVCVFV